MPITFVPLELGLIDEGAFQEDFEKALTKAQTVLGKFFNKHGTLSKGGKVKITATVEIAIEDSKDGTTKIKSSVVITRPTEPASYTRANLAEDQTGQMQLHVRKSGSTEDNPKQEVIDFDKTTGEIKK